MRETSQERVDKRIKRTAAEETKTTNIPEKLRPLNTPKSLREAIKPKYTLIRFPTTTSDIIILISLNLINSLTVNERYLSIDELFIITMEI